MEHRDSVVFKGDVARAFDFAAGALVERGFRIDSRTEDRLVASGPTGNGAGHLLGVVTLVAFQAHEGELTLAAELGAMAQLRRRMLRIVVALPLCLFVVQATAFSFLYRGSTRGITIGAAGGLNAFLIALWIFLGPRFLKMLEERIRGALDDLLYAAARAGERI